MINISEDKLSKILSISTIEKNSLYFKVLDLIEKNKSDIAAKELVMEIQAILAGKEQLILEETGLQEDKQLGLAPLSPIFRRVL